MCAASLLNPYGADGSLYVLKSLGEAAYGGAIVEMQPLWVQLGPLFAVPVATMALGPIALCRRSGARVPAGAAAMLLAGIAAGVLHSRCMWIAGLFCGLCCAFGLAGALGEPVAHPGRAAAAAGAAMALIAAVSGLAVSLAPQSGGEAGMLSVTESEMSPIFSAIYDAGSDALVFSSDVSVYNQLEWEGFKVPCDMRPEIWGDFTTIDDFFDTKLKENYGYGIEELREKLRHPGRLQVPQVRDGRLRDDGQPGFQTVTGRVELYSYVLEAYDEKPVPYFEEPDYSPVSQPPEVVEKYPLVYTTGGRHISAFHSEHRQVPSLRALHPDPLVTINPATAEKYGIREGDWVRVDTMFGKCTQKAHLTYEVNEKTIHLEHAWWFPEQDGEAPNLFGVFDANANNLIPHESVGVTGYGAPYRTASVPSTRVDSMKD